MMRVLKKIVKKILINSPLTYSERFDSLLRLTLLKKWINKYQPFRNFQTRELLYTFISEEITGNIPITYLEFGVYKGDSMNFWTKLNTNVNSKFFGFDSFLGLPESWINISTVKPKSSFSTDGNPPNFSDDRVKVIKGWFHNTLSEYLRDFPVHNQLIIHCDADIYASTLYVLCRLDTIIVQDTIIIFDDFTSVLHDFRAMDDYSSAFNRQYIVLGAAGPNKCEQVAIQIIV